jgi:hypothetical protein
MRRPPLSPEVQDLIRTMSCQNRLWGTERIRGELLTLGIVVSNRSIRRYRWRGPMVAQEQILDPTLLRGVLKSRSS